jgi:hypothetical protein
MLNVSMLIISAGSFCGGMGGAIIGTVLVWRRHFVTRDEAVVMGRAIDAQRRMLDDMLRIMEAQCEADLQRVLG